MLGWLKRFLGAEPEQVPKKPVPRSPVPLADSEIAGRLTTLCETYVGYPVSFEDLRHWRQMVANRHPEMQVLASLDDLQQALYTSGHCVDAHGLDETEGHDLSYMSPDRFDEGGFADSLRLPEDFPIRLANFQAGLKQAPVREGKQAWVDPNTELPIHDVNEDPDVVTSDFGIIQAVSVARAVDMIAAFPNGYFAGDLTPFDLHRLATELEPLGYQLIAIGAAYVAFWAEAELDDTQVAHRSVILADLYEAPDIDRLNLMLTGERHLILRYTG